MTPFKKLWPLAIAVVAVLSIGSIACNDDDADAETSAETEARLQRVEVLAAVNALEATEFHAIDDELQVASEIPEGTQSSIERALQISSSTEWPDELAKKADTLNTTMEDFVAALEAGDLQASKGLATETHDAWHELQHDVYPWIAGEEHAKEEDGHSDDGGESEESPEATATP